MSLITNALLSAASPFAAQRGGSGWGFNWFDLAVLVMLIVGYFRGRKRGMSEELLDLIQWLLIIALGCVLYEPVGVLFARLAGLSLLYAYLAVYLATALLIKILFTLFKRTVGEKLISSDFFGNLEYYLGMVSGTLRYACIVMLFLAVLHARYFSDAELVAEARAQEKELGSVYFPTLGMVHQSVFHESFTGRFVEQNLGRLLIAPTKPGTTQKQENIGKRREHEVNEVLGIQ